MHTWFYSAASEKLSLIPRVGKTKARDEFERPFHTEIFGDTPNVGFDMKKRSNWIAACSDWKFEIFFQDYEELRHLEMRLWAHKCAQEMQFPWGMRDLCVGEFVFHMAEQDLDTGECEISVAMRRLRHLDCWACCKGCCFGLGDDPLHNCEGPVYTWEIIMRKWNIMSIVGIFFLYFRQC